MSSYLRPTGAVAADALLVGDPKRAMDLAAHVMEKPLMSNLSRGLWGYHGVTRRGRELTVQATGIGGPSAAAVVSELASLGVGRAIRVGTCTAIDPLLEPGRALVVEAVIAADGVGARLANGAMLTPDPALTAALLAQTGGKPARVASTDLSPDDGVRARWRLDDVAAFDLSTAAVMAVGAKHGIRCACALVVAATSAGVELSDEALDHDALELGARTAAALEAPTASVSSGPR